MFDLRRIRELDERLGGPSRSLRCVHVAGTKGKGSTCHMLSSIFTAAGYRTGLFTSPHLVDVEERIQVDNTPIAPADFAELIGEVADPAEAMRARGEADSPTFFEMLTECAFLHFVRQGVDLAVIEVGLGGRLDSTNIVSPLVSVVTEIGIDHRAELGDTIEQIAREKCGIVKPGAPVVASTTQPIALEIVRQFAAERGAPLTVAHERLHASAVDLEGLDTSFRIDELDLDCRLPLVGEHQVRNALCAAAVCEVLAERGKVVVPPAKLAEGLAGVRLEGRFSLYGGSGPDDPLVVADVAHNPLSVATMLATWHRRLAGRRFVLLFAASGDKDVEGMLSLLAPLAEAAVLTKACSPRSKPLEELEPIARGAGLDAIVCDDSTAAYNRAITLAREKGLPLLVTGTFYLVGEVLRLRKTGVANPHLVGR